MWSARSPDFPFDGFNLCLPHSALPGYRVPGGGQPRLPPTAVPPNRPAIQTPAGHLEEGKGDPARRLAQLHAHHKAEGQDGHQAARQGGRGRETRGQAGWGHCRRRGRRGGGGGTARAKEPWACRSQHRQYSRTPSAAGPPPCVRPSRHHPPEHHQAVEQAVIVITLEASALPCPRLLQPLCSRFGCSQQATRSGSGSGRRMRRSPRQPRKRRRAASPCPCRPHGPPTLVALQGGAHARRVKLGPALVVPGLQQERVPPAVQRNNSASSAGQGGPPALAVCPTAQTQSRQAGCPQAGGERGLQAMRELAPP